LSPDVKKAAGIQKLEGMKDPTYGKNIMKLKFIPTNLTEQILDGIQPIEMTTKNAEFVLYNMNVTKSDMVKKYVKTD